MPVNDAKRHFNYLTYNELKKLIREIYAEGVFCFTAHALGKILDSTGEWSVNTTAFFRKAQKKLLIKKKVI